MTPVVIAELIWTYTDKTGSGNLAQHSQNRNTRTGVGPGKSLVHILSETREPNNAKKEADLKSVYKKIRDLQWFGVQLEEG